MWGVVLAGGRSTRFGREKAAADFAGRPLIAWAAEALAAGCARVAVNAPRGSAAAQFARDNGLDLISDAPHTPQGPLAGIEAGLAWARASGVEMLASAPCDTPLLPHDLVPRLASALDAEHGAAMARTSQGLQPLCALWRTSALAPIADALKDARHPPIRSLLCDLGAAEVMFADERRFMNVNAPEDHASALAHRQAARDATSS